MGKSFCYMDVSEQYQKPNTEQMQLFNFLNRLNDPDLV